MHTRDIRRYYARLGLHSSATAAEIKAAFRRLAKETHPDRSAHLSDGVEFRAVSEAYQVLSDPARRAEYDSAGAATGAKDSHHDVQIEPIRCSICAKITAQPRYIVFRNVVSLILVTMRNPVQGIYCFDCARALGLKATFLSALVGWWGIPWGPIFTIGEGLRNAVGGGNIQQNEDRLLWQNAVAFAQRGDLKLALGLAERVEFSADADIAERAGHLIEMLRSQGLTNEAPLKSPWSLNPSTS
jgi:hypothetical protein